jgi:hypothetical protein
MCEIADRPVAIGCSEEAQTIADLDPVEKQIGTVAEQFPILWVHWGLPANSPSARP